MIQTWLDKLRRYLPQPPVTTLHSLLIDEAEMQLLRAEASQQFGSLIRFERSVAHQRLGDRLSRFRGQGFEFEENRRYQPGDEHRLINWRQFARRGELFTKVFIEERRPEVTLLVDRRATMRFGTRTRLKAALAAQLAVYTLLQANHQVIPVGGVVLDEETRWFFPALGEVGLAPLMETIIAPCPPQPFEREQESLQQVLSQLDMRLGEGSFILLLSDFWDLEPELAAPVLHRLGEKHTVQAIQIHDQVEKILPPLDPLLIEDSGSGQTLVIDDHGRAYHSAIEQHQFALQDCFAQNGIAFHPCDTKCSWRDCLRHAIQGTA